MNVDKIILPDFLIADLYKNCLVDIGNPQDKQQALSAETLSEEKEIKISLPGKIKYYGENGKNITIVVNQPGSKHLAKEDLTFLTNILQACQLSAADIAIVNIAQQQVSYTALKEQLNVRQILLFQVEPSLIDLPFKIPPFQIQNYADCAIMLAPALSALNKPTHEGRLLKTKLWNSLKQLFGI